VDREALERIKETFKCLSTNISFIFEDGTLKVKCSESERLKCENVAKCGWIRDTFTRVRRRR
jgi:hypothetical protein